MLRVTLGINQSLLVSLLIGLGTSLAEISPADPATMNSANAATLSPRVGKPGNHEAYPIQEATDPIEQARQFKPALTGIMTDAIRALRERIEAGPPFLLEERRARVARLEVMIQQPTADLAELFQWVIEAYRIELDYGKTVEVTRGPLPEDSRKLVDFLSVGCLALYYQTLDGRESAIWSNRDRQWQRLSSENNELITEDLRMARKDIPPGLMTLPLPGTDQP